MQVLVPRYGTQLVLAVGAADVVRTGAQDTLACGVAPSLDAIYAYDVAGFSRDAEGKILTRREICHGIVDWVKVEAVGTRLELRPGDAMLLTR